MTVQPLTKGDTFYDPVLNAVLRADGSLSVHNTHEMTMVWPSYTALDMSDSVITRLIPADYDMWNATLKYTDPSSAMMIVVDLNTGKSASYTQYAIVNNATTQSPSQKNWGWSSKDEEKKPEPKKSLFKVGAVLFHKDTRTKWVLAETSGSGRSFELRALDDKTKTVSVFENELDSFEEIFF